MGEVWFWQLMISPHMADLAVSLAQHGCKVTYVAQRAISVERAQQGWSAPALPGVELKWADSDAAVNRLVQLAPADSVHLCQGVRANQRVGLAQRALQARGLRQWVLMETVDDAGRRGIIKRLVYTCVFRAWRDKVEGVLAIGHRTADWVVARGIPSARVYPFAYFLPANRSADQGLERASGPFRFLFAGQLIPRKRVTRLINALAALTDQTFELWIVGTGTQEPSLRSLAEKKLTMRVRWFGQRLLTDLPSIMMQVDCLVLPSAHDGWGAVASEAMIAGTPVICSDACGAAGAVHASRAGGVFPVNCEQTLKRLLADQLAHGPQRAAARRQLALWATCLSAPAGAAYLQAILVSDRADNAARPVAPWRAAVQARTMHRHRKPLSPAATT